MVGMSLISFLVLLGIAIVVAVVFHFVLWYRFLDGLDSFLGKVALGWLGGWLGSPVFGYWGFKLNSVYVIPALLGAATAAFLCVLWWKAQAKAGCGSSGT
ncbi:MAG: hypothetical protein FJW34_09815 [Acidobacteria bacterium]|nr:hypothetical protein [Acidobacteriota bacterium]